MTRNRDVIEQRLFELAPMILEEDGGELTRERMRQIARQATKVMADIVASSDDFQIMRGDRRVAKPKATAAKVEVVDVRPLAAMPDLMPGGDSAAARITTTERFSHSVVLAPVGRTDRRDDWSDIVPDTGHARGERLPA